MSEQLSYKVPEQLSDNGIYVIELDLVILTWTGVGKNTRTAFILYDRGNGFAVDVAGVLGLADAMQADALRVLPNDKVVLIERLLTGEQLPSDSSGVQFSSGVVKFHALELPPNEQTISNSVSLMYTSHSRLHAAAANAVDEIKYSGLFSSSAE